MKKTLQIMLLLMCFATGFAQTAIPNANFESWDNAGSSTAEPTSWNSNKTGTGYATYGPQTCFQNSSAHSGNYSARIASSSYFGTVVNGALATGRVEAPSTNKADGYISSVVGNTGYISTFTGRPDSLIFWYQYTSVSSDYPTVQARLHVGSAYAPETPSNNNHPVCTQNIIARALWTGPSSTVTGWTRAAVPFVYDSTIAPTYILISTTSSGNQTGGSSGSTLYLDDFLAYYIPVLTTGTVATGPYYVTAATSTSISVPFTLTGTVDSSNVVTAQLSDASGSFASPVAIGTLATLSSGTITATIPAGTATGAGYRVRVITNHPSLTAANNGSNITINLISTAVAPATTQNIAANTNGTVLTVTESVAATSRQWKYATVSGGPYQAFTTAQTGTTYTPYFSAAGTYYIVCVSTYPGSLVTTSNQVQVNVVANSIAPTSSQSILVNTNGTTLTVTESSTATSRQWKYSTTSGSGYVSFSTAQTGTTYTPNFAAAGNYYLVCVSLINGVSAVSNEVQISVGTATITTSAITGSPFLFSHSAPAAAVSVAYIASTTFGNGNVFTAQLSDASGSFTNPTIIGQRTATTSGTITASIPGNTPAGTGYRIRVISSAPVVLGSDNGTDLVVDQFHSLITPGTTQTIQYNTNGTALTASASQTSTYTWEYSTVSGSGYMGFTIPQTGATYIPNFSTPGTYYVVCISKNTYNDNDTSNEVEIIVENGSVINTLNVTGSPYLTSNSANVQISVGFTSDVQFATGNIFQVQLSDNTGSFASPVVIGAVTATSIAPVSATIPNATAAGTHYRVRVVSSNPAVIGTADSIDLTVIPFSISLAPVDTQNIEQNHNGTAITASSSQPASYNWQYSAVSGLGYAAFAPAETNATYTPNFINTGTYYVVCNITNAIGDSLLSPEVVVNVTRSTAINEVKTSIVKAYWDHNDFVIDLTAAYLHTPVLQLVNVLGQVVDAKELNTNNINRLNTSLPQGVYIFKIVDGQQTFTGKTVKR